MVEFYTKYLYDGEVSPQKKDKGKTSFRYEYIWEKQPSRKDVSLKYSLSKTIFLIIMGFLFMIGTYLLSKNVFLAIGLTIILELVFSLVFYEGFFLWKGRATFHPFKHIIFWQIKEDQNTLYYTNHIDLLTVGMKIFYVETIPENVHPSLLHFLKALSGIEQCIPFTYQVVHAKQRSGAFKTYIFFIIVSSTNGTLNKRKIGILQERLFHYGLKFKSLFAADFHHFRIIPLTGKSLIGAVRSSLFQEDFNEFPLEEVVVRTFNRKTTVLKTVFILLLLVVFNAYFMLLFFPILVICLFNIIFIPVLLLIWWKEILFQLFSLRIFTYDSISVLDPFYNIKFYFSNRIPDIIFAHVNNKEIIGMKIYTVNNVSKPPYCSFSKFFSGVNSHQIPFTYTIISTPLSFYQLDKEYGKEVREKIRQFMLKRLSTDGDRQNWLNRRGGIWESILILSTTFRIRTEHFTTKSVSTIDECLHKAGITLRETFTSNFSNFNLVTLHKQWLLSGFQCELLKNKHIWANGSHLKYVAYQGTALMNMITIANELKKGVKTQIAAEFNTPLQLENFIEIGNAFNTETLTKEVKAGFLFDQLHSILLTNGTHIDRELLSMKIAIELIKKEIPCLIFDFTGNWSKILTYFKGTKYQQNILHFKLGKAFTLNPFNSEIPYEKDNMYFLDFMFDAYAMCFRKDMRFMHSFKNSIRKFGGNLNLAKIDLEHKPEFEKNATVEGLLSTLTDISQEDLGFLHIKDEEILRVHEFIRTPHTVIIDFSISHDLPTLCFFMFLILAKIIRYCSHCPHYISKFVLLPHIDIVFESNFLDKVANYGKINKFFDPLRQKKFGIICSANQIHYLHPHIFNYLNNIVTFQATDSRDIATLSNLLNLNELHGTGYYNPKRNETYQIHFLRNMDHYEVIMKRLDLNQSFPVILQVEEVKNIKLMEYHEIVEHMSTQGYDLELNENRILILAQKTKLERDLGEYSVYKEDLISFFDQIKTVQDVAGLYEKKVKKLLLEYLYAKLSQHYSHNKKLIAAIRNTIYEILRKHDYLVEHHPKMASGGQSTRTCLIIGPAYEKAIQEYYEAKQNNPAHIAVNVIKKESSSSPKIANFLTPELSIQTELKIKSALVSSFGGKMVSDLFKINRYIEKKDYSASLKISRAFLPTFLKNSYIYYYNPNYDIKKKDIIEFIKLISDIEGFPFQVDELIYLLERCERFNFEHDNLEHISKELYTLLYDFYKKLKKFLNK